jgi:hypothetical protein
MQSRWLVAGAGVAGIILAFIVIKSPDTGDAVNAPATEVRPAEQQPGEAPTAVDAPEAPAPTEAASGVAAPKQPSAEAPGLVRPGTASPVVDRSKEIIPGPNPLAREALEKRSQPEAVISGKASIPWTLIRRNLTRVDSDQARELSEVSNQLVLDLRRMRRDPDTFSYDEIEQRQRSLQEQIRSGGFNSDEEIEQMLGRVDEILGEYHTNNK